VEKLSRALLQKSERVLLFGPPGAGKSYLAAQLGRRLQEEDRTCVCLSADPGSPGFGIPAAINLGIWKQDNWQREDFESLCSLDAARFRLQAGHDEMVVLPARTIEDGVIYQEERFLVRTVDLDHGTPVLAYAYEPVAAVVVSEEALDEFQLPAGPWLGKLKYTYMAGEHNRLIELPSGDFQPVGLLASRLLRKQEGKNWCTPLTWRIQSRTGKS